MWTCCHWLQQAPWEMMFIHGALHGPRRGDKDTSFAKDLQDRGRGRGGKGSVHACHHQTSGGRRAKFSGRHPGI